MSATHGVHPSAFYRIGVSGGNTNAFLTALYMSVHGKPPSYDVTGLLMPEYSSILVNLDATPSASRCIQGRILVPDVSSVPACVDDVSRMIREAATDDAMNGMSTIVLSSVVIPTMITPSAFWAFHYVPSEYFAKRAPAFMTALARRIDSNNTIVPRTTRWASLLPTTRVLRVVDNVATPTCVWELVKGDNIATEVNSEGAPTRMAPVLYVASGHVGGTDVLARATKGPSKYVAHHVIFESDTFRWACGRTIVEEGMFESKGEEEAPASTVRLSPKLPLFDVAVGGGKMHLPDMPRNESTVWSASPASCHDWPMLVVHSVIQSWMSKHPEYAKLEIRDLCSKLRTLCEKCASSISHTMGLQVTLTAMKKGAKGLPACQNLGDASGFSKFQQWLTSHKITAFPVPDMFHNDRGRDIWTSCAPILSGLLHASAMTDDTVVSGMTKIIQGMSSILYTDASHEYMIAVKK